MRRVENFSLNQFSKDELERRQKNLLKGGKSCGCQGPVCGCHYAGGEHPDYYGGSSSIDNAHANNDLLDQRLTD